MHAYFSIVRFHLITASVLVFVNDAQLRFAEHQLQLTLIVTSSALTVNNDIEVVVCEIPHSRLHQLRDRGKKHLRLVINRMLPYDYNAQLQGIGSLIPIARYADWQGRLAASKPRYQYPPHLRQLIVACFFIPRVLRDMLKTVRAKR